MRIAGSVARIVMAKWAEKVLEIMSKNNIEVWLAAIYVDDVRFVTSLISQGTRWDGKKKKFASKKEWQEEDEKDGLSDECRTARELLKAMNSVFHNIQFTSEIPQDFPNNRLPTLDFTCWLEDDFEIDGASDNIENGEVDEDQARTRSRIFYSFFEKPMSSPFCILEQSALPENTKIASLSQEVVRRMLNTSELVSQQERNQVIETFITKLRVSGYHQEKIRRII